MRAVRVCGWGEAPRLEEVDRPRAGEGESLVRVEAAALAHLDLTVAGGRFGIRPDLPYIAGVEGCGVVVTSDIHPAGTRVLLRGGGLGLTRAGTWAEYVVARSRHLVAAPPGLDAALCATFWVPTTTAHAALHQVGRLGRWFEDLSEAAEHVAVAGAAGAVGSMVVQLALRAGADVTALVLSHDQADALPAGVSAVVTSDAAALAAYAEERPASLLVDTIGGPDLTARARVVRPGGRAVVVGYVAGNEVRLDLSNWLLDDVALLPTNMIRRESDARRAAPVLAGLLAEGVLHLGVEQFGFEEVERAVELLREGRLHGRGVLVPGGAW